MVGNLLGGYCGGRFGPRRTIMASCVPAFQASIILAASPHLSTLILARVLCGLNTGLNTSNGPLLVAEYRWEEREEEVVIVIL